MSGMHRSFSFDAHDDDPSYHPLYQKPASPPQQYSRPEQQYSQQYSQPEQQYSAPLKHYSPRQYAPQQYTPVQQQYSSSPAQDYYPPPAPVHRHQYDDDDDPTWPPASPPPVNSTYSPPPMEHQSTVIRKSIPPAAAAAAAAALAAVQEDLAPQERNWEPVRGYSQSSSESPFPVASIATPLSESSLITGAPQPPPHGAGSGGGPVRQRVLVDPLMGQYTDNPYKRTSTTWDPVLAQAAFDGAQDVLSDDDDDFGEGRRGVQGVKGAGAFAATESAHTAPVVAEGMRDGGMRGGAMERGGLLARDHEKSEWLQSQKKSSKKAKWIIALVLLVLLLGAGGGAAAGVILSKKGKSSNSKPDSTTHGASNLTAAEDIRVNGDLTKDSAEIKELLNNPSLHRVFHGMDYTPFNGVYPECIARPPTQNNITRDIAVLSLLTDKIRLYGTDCNQTEMVLHAIDALGVDMKVWIGVWLDGNTTTNARQLDHLYKLISDDKHHDKYAGVAVGNEVLFAKTLTETALFDIVSEVRTNLTNLGYKIPVGTSDLGSNWNREMASKVDVLMANVHPFFAGVLATDAANWTYTFFQENDVVYTKGLDPPPRVMISEVGWPSGGGTNMGSVAGIDEMNQFMHDFVCKENKRGTEYFWFSGFDEPWKIKFNEPKLGKEWEDKWGLLDINRNLKKGLNIPDCK